MMHSWSEVPKEIEQMKNQNVGEPFIYKDFDFQIDEFDNVPPVIPRFQFYLQLNIKPLFEYCKKLNDA